MDIVAALKQEEVRLHEKLVAIKGAIAALNGAKASASPLTNTRNGHAPKRTMSATLRAKLSRKAKERWAKVRAEQSKGKKS